MEPLSTIVSQLASFSISNYSYTPDTDLKVLFGRMLHQLKHFEQNIDCKVEEAVSQINHNKNKEFLPQIPQNSQKETQKPKTPSLSDTLKNLTNRLNNNNRLNNIKKPKIELSHSLKTLKTKSKSGFLRNSHIFPRNVILSKEMRQNPFADLPPLSIKDLKKGLLSLQTIGVIPKDLDLGPAFNKNPPLNTEIVRVHQQFEKPKKKIQSLNKDETLNILLDTKTFVTEKPIFEKSSLVNEEKLKILSMINKKKELIKEKPPEKIIFELKNGKISENEKDFVKIKKYYSDIWNNILIIFKKIEVLLSENQIKFATLDGKKIIKLSKKVHLKSKNSYKIDKKELINCIMNQEIIKSSMLIPNKKFKGGKATEIAAKIIQEAYRKRRYYKRYLLDKLKNKCARKIQNNWRLHKILKNTKIKIKEVENENEEEYEFLLNKFKKEWDDIKCLERVEIHINSFAFEENQRYTMENYIQRANSQISRIFALKDPLIEIIYILPIEIAEDINNYYTKVLQLGEIDNYAERLHFIYPEVSSYFPYTLSTIKKLIYSSKAIRQIRKIIGLKPAYIVSGYPSKNDILLSRKLKIPCFNGNPHNCLELSSKTGCRKLFESCDIPIGPGKSNLKNEIDFIDSLVNLIYLNLSISTWIFKIDNEFGGRGIAYFSIDFIRLMNQIRNSKLDENGEKYELKKIIRNLLPIKIQMATPTLYRNYSEFIMYFIAKGGIIEAAPPNIKSDQISSISISLLVEPNQNFKILSVFEKITGPEYRNIGYINSPKLYNGINYRLIANKIIEKLIKFDVFGYVTIDLLVFSDPILKNTSPLFWAIGLDCYLNDLTSILFYFEFLIKGKLDPMSGKYHHENIIGGDPIPSAGLNSIQNEENIIKTEKFFLYCPGITHPSLSLIEYKEFFQKCRSELILFDLEKKTGTSFLLVDSLKNSFLNFISIGSDYNNTIKNMTNALNFVSQYVGSLGEHKFERSRKDIRHDIILFSDIVNRIRTINKETEKRN